MNTIDTFFLIPPINSKPYWDKRIELFQNTSSVKVKEREAFFLEFFISGHLDNKSKIARKLRVPYTDIDFNNPNAQIIIDIAKRYKFHDHSELKRVSEGFFHYYKQAHLLNDFWIKNYTELAKTIDNRYIMLCVFTFLTLCYPASYNSYFEKKTSTKFVLYDVQVKGLGFSSISSLVEFSVAFCKPGTVVPFAWNPHKMDNTKLFWNLNENKSLAEEFPEVLANFLSSGYSMRHESYTLFKKLDAASFPVSFAWKRPQTNVAKEDKERIQEIITKLQAEHSSNTGLPNEPVASSENNTVPISKSNDSNAIELQIRNMVDKICHVFEPIVSQLKGDVNSTIKQPALLKQIYDLQNSLHETSNAELSSLENILENLEALLTNLNNYYTKNTTTDTTGTIVSQQEQIFHAALNASVSQNKEHEPTKGPMPAVASTLNFKLLQEQYNNQSVLLSNTLKKNKELQLELEQKISPDALRIVLAKYFKPESLDKLIHHLSRQ